MATKNDGYGRATKSEAQLKERLKKRRKKRPLTHREQSLKDKRKERRRVAKEKQRIRQVEFVAGKGKTAPKKSVKITFDLGEWNHALAIGRSRIVSFTHAKGSELADPDKLEYDIGVIAPVAERAVAKCFGVPWESGLPNVVGGAVVQGTRYKTGSLTLHKNDSEKKVNILVTVNEAERSATIVGWIYGKEGKDPQYWGDPFSTGRPAFWVPQSKLRPIGDLSFEKAKIVESKTGQRGIGDF